MQVIWMEAVRNYWRYAYRGSYMSAHVLLILWNELGEQIDVPQRV